MEGRCGACCGSWTLALHYVAICMCFRIRAMLSSTPQHRVCSGGTAVNQARTQLMTLSGSRFAREYFTPSPKL